MLGFLCVLAGLRCLAVGADEATMFTSKTCFKDGTKGSPCQKPQDCCATMSCGDDDAIQNCAQSMGAEAGEKGFSTVCNVSFESQGNSSCWLRMCHGDDCNKNLEFISSASRGNTAAMISTFAPLLFLLSSLRF